MVKVFCNHMIPPVTHSEGVGGGKRQVNEVS